MKKIKKHKTEEVDEFKNQLARALADYDNLKKRTEEEKIMWIKFAGGRVVERLLPILDMVESAQNHLKDPGLAIVTGEFRKTIKDEGVEEIKPKVGDSFNPESQEVVDTVDTKEENKNNTIESVSLVGWKFKDGGVIRPAKVKVYKLEIKN